MTTKLLKQVSDQIESVLETMENKNNVSYFQSTEHNFDAIQNLNMNESKKELEKNVEKNKIDVNDFSITDAKDYLGCIGNQCNNLGEKSELNNNFMNNNIDNDKENSKNSKNSKISSSFITNLDYIITFVFIFLISILLISSILNKKNNNLVYILLLTLVFIFYKIYFVKS